MARAALVLALAGIVAVLSGGLLFLTAGSATSVNPTGDTPCVPSDPWTETTDWVLVSPGDGWRQVDQRTVVDQEAYDEVVQEAYVQHYSWRGGRRAHDDPPTVVPPDENWVANTRSEPHENGAGNPAAWLDESLHYTANSDHSASWFYLEHVPAVVVHHDAVTHEELRFAFDHPAVVCPTEPPTTEPPTTPPTTTPPTTEPPTTPPTTEPPTTPADDAAHDRAADDAAADDAAADDAAPRGAPDHGDRLAGAEPGAVRGGHAPTECAA
ncbi:exported hypothetical protein [metagenome]|uniref:Uncharacterized protein n=1 Tax=metagenome TaxID=256318 RepID=A0A2P2CHI8_9ZZZZ